MVANVEPYQLPDKPNAPKRTNRELKLNQGKQQQLPKNKGSLPLNVMPLSLGIKTLCMPKVEVNFDTATKLPKL